MDLLSPPFPQPPLHNITPYNAFSPLADKRNRPQSCANTEYRLLVEEETYSHSDPDTENIIVQGDNLEALKALLPFYAGQVKCIYIDPPYNTGSVNVYRTQLPDDLTNVEKAYLDTLKKMQKKLKVGSID